MTSLVAGLAHRNTFFDEKVCSAAVCCADVSRVAMHVMLSQYPDHLLLLSLMNQ